MHYLYLLLTLEASNIHLPTLGEWVSAQAHQKSKETTRKKENKVSIFRHQTVKRAFSPANSLFLSSPCGSTCRQCSSELPMEPCPGCLDTELHRDVASLGFCPSCNTMMKSPEPCERGLATLYAKMTHSIQLILKIHFYPQRKI